MPETILTESVSRQIWDTRYRLIEDGHMIESSIEASWDRVAQALAAPEPHHRDEWRERFRQQLARFRFLPGGRILAGAGSGKKVTLLNCFAAGTLSDSVEGVFGGLAEAMITLQAGGGIGCDFSTLHPASADGQHVGPTAFLPVWDQACNVLRTGGRHGAMMATLRCDHPDVERFIEAKRIPGVLSHFNLALLVTDDFMRAVEHDEPWRLVYPLGHVTPPPDAAVCDRIWPGAPDPQTCLVYRTVSARDLWRRLHRAAFETGDPGVLFIDRIRQDNNLYYAEQIATTNPCGEVPLPPHGACNLGSINLVQFVEDPFGKAPRLDFSGIVQCAEIAVRMLDNVYELAEFPLRSQARTALASRRIGLGITGLADALAMLGLRYGSPAAEALARRMMETICHAAYRSSVILARERGSFPLFDPERYLCGGFVSRLPPDIRADIARDGIRNSHLIALAPAGSISLLANNVSSGIEPIYMLEGQRSLRAADGKYVSVPVQDFAWRLLRAMAGPAVRPASLLQAGEVTVPEQLALQRALQEYVDQSIAKTVLLPASARLADVEGLYSEAYRLGLKSCTMYHQRSPC